MADELPEPKSRKESYLAKAAGMNVTIPEKPESRLEQYLDAIAEGGGGGGGGSYTAGDGIDITDSTISVDTDTIQEKLTAGTGIDITNNTISATGGGGPTVVQTTGTSTTDVMSQNATTKLVYPDIANNPYKMVIGEGLIYDTNKGVAINGTLNTGITGGSIAIGTPNGGGALIGQNGRADQSVAIGNSATVGHGAGSVAIGAQAYVNSGTNTGYNVALGYNAYAGNAAVNNTVALGANAKTTRTGEVNIGTGGQNAGYNSTDYRVLGGVHDPVDAHDAATKEYVDNQARRFFNIADIVRAAHENPGVQETITLEEYEAVQEACMNFLPLAYCIGDGIVYEFTLFSQYDCTYSSGINVYGETISSIMGNFTFQFNNGQPYVRFDQT